MYTVRRAFLPSAAVGLLVGGLALVSASCFFGRTAPEPVASSLVVRNRSVFDVNVYAMPSVAAAPIRLGTVVGTSTATLPVHASDLAVGGVLVVRIHAIGSNLSWTSPGVSVGSGMLAILDVNSDPFGDCSSSSLHAIVTTDSVPVEKRYKNFRVSRIAVIAGNEHIHHVFTGRESVNRAFSRDVVGGQRVSNSALTRRL